MMNVKHLVAGFVIGVVMAVAPSCGGTKACSASTCPTGCCDAKGECMAGTSNGACGQLGSVCAVCQFGTACNLGTCMNTSSIGGGGGSQGGGGGTTGGGTGGGATTGGGGGATCDGCIFNGGCIIKANSNNDTLCGQGGVACATCTGTTHCTNYVCSGGTTGGGGGTPTGGGGGTPTGGGGGTPTGGGGGTTVAVGAPCTNSTQCAGLGVGATCKLQTTPFSGNAPTSYPSGFCTRPCTGPGTCPGGSACGGGVSSYPYLFNEVDRVCMPSCTSTSNCTSGFQCIPVEPLTGAAPANGCFLSLANATYAGGGLPTKAGQPCTTDSQCGSPPDPILGQCLTDADGFYQGYCLITSGLETSGAWCQSAGRSMAIFNLADGGTSEQCTGSCTTPGARLSNVTTSRDYHYACYTNTNNTGNVMWTACMSNSDCFTGYANCNLTTGMCCTDTTYTTCATAF